ncbi:MAG: GTPase [Planctomycetota bacterium]|jgi:tRNA modification GTPase
MTGTGASWSYSLTTPAGTGAIAILDVVGDIESFFAATGIEPVGVGGVRLRELCALDTGLVARVSKRHAQLMSHGGKHLASRLLGALEDAGGDARGGGEGLCEWYPEAADIYEARMLEALPRASDARTVELLLDQPSRWRAFEGEESGEEIVRHSRVLDRLLTTQTIVVLGEANIGKSTLTNAMAAGSVSIVSATAGTTRDHVGVELVVAGIRARWIDTPGLREGDVPGVEREASRLALELARGADLVVLCADASSEWPRWECGEGQRVMRVGLRGDLGLAEGCEVQTSAGRDGEGVAALGGAIRESLVPEREVASGLPWRFWDAS